MTNPKDAELDRLLALIEPGVDLGHCRRVDERYRRALAWEPVDRPPLVVQAGFGTSLQLPPPWDGFRRYSYREAFDNPVAMLQNMLLARVVPGVLLKDDNPLAIRNDHGTIQIAGLLGGAWQMYEDNYPWVAPLGSTEAVRALVESDRPVDWNAGVLPRSTRTLAFYRDALARFPRCRQAVQISLPDLQGPMDTADMLWGNELFVAALDDPGLFDALLAKVGRTMRAVVEHYRQFAVDRLDPFANTQHGYAIPGRLLIRDDSAIMVSPGTYRERVGPHDAALLESVGTGSIHFCGNGQHLIEPMLELAPLRGIDLGQCEMMDMDWIYRRCAPRKVALTDVRPPRQDLVTGQARRAFPTGVVFVYYAESLDDARQVVTAYGVGTG